MHPTMPTPQEAAQWVMEAHVALMARQITQPEHDEVLGHLAAVYDEMAARDVARALGAMTDIAEELSVELINHGADPARVLALLRTGIGRVHVTQPLPEKHSSIGIIPARRLAAVVARTSLWAHLLTDCYDDQSLDAFTEDLDNERAALEQRPVPQLLLVTAVLGQFSDYLLLAGAPRTTMPNGTTPRTVEQCRRDIDQWASVISSQSQTLYAHTGSMDRAWAAHREHFD